MCVSCQLPRSGVEGLQSNFLINDLLNHTANTGARSITSPPCEKHHEELVELYCEICDEPICHACLVIDHRYHTFSSIKEAFPRKKSEIAKLMNEAKREMSALRAEVVSVEDKENKVRTNAGGVNEEIDDFIDTLINEYTAILERERQRLKQEVYEKTSLQLSKLQDQKETLAISVSSVEFAKQSLACTNRVEFLRSKNEITGKLTELRSLTEQFHPCERVVYKLVKKPLEEEKFQGVGELKAHGQCCLSMPGGEPGVVYTGRAWQWCEFRITINGGEAYRRNLLKDFKITIQEPNEGTYVSIPLEDKPSSSRGFTYRPTRSGDYKIFLFNEQLFGGEAHCSPVVWKVLPAFSLKSTWVGGIDLSHPGYLSNCVFEDGQHSWRVRMLRPSASEPPNYSHEYFQIGVKHPFRDEAWYWQNKQHISPGNSVPSSIKSLQRDDVFVCFLDVCKRQLIVYNERSKESDVWRDIQVPVTPYLSPDGFLSSGNFEVLNGLSELSVANFCMRWLVLIAVCLFFIVFSQPRK